MSVLVVVVVLQDYSDNCQVRFLISKNGIDSIFFHLFRIDYSCKDTYPFMQQSINTTSIQAIVVSIL